MGAIKTNSFWKEGKVIDNRDDRLFNLEAFGRDHQRGVRSVACDWAGAVMRKLFAREKHYGRTDNRPTDTETYRVACTRLTRETFVVDQMLIECVREDEHATLSKFPSVYKKRHKLSGY